MITIARIAVLAGASLLASPALAVQAPKAPAAPQATASEWPQAATMGSVTYTINEPSYTAISGNTVTLKAVVQSKPASGKSATGTLQLTAVMASTDSPGVVELNQFTINDCTMDDGSGAAAKDAFTKLLEGIGFDATLSTIVQGIAVDSTRNVPGLASTTPAIKVVEHPAVLISVNGQPKFGDCGSSGWKRVVNTPCILLQSPENAWYARVGGTQWVSAATMSGPFSAASAPPQDVVNALGKQPEPPADLKANVNARLAKHLPSGPPDIVVATSPTVLVSIAGAPSLETVCDGVEHVKNTGDTVLRSGGQWWVLGAGRWFASSDLKNGPWTLVAASDLPPAFANIPATGTLAAARASVPGSNEAKTASVTHDLVRTVTLPRNGATCDVRFRGPAAFAPVQGTNLAYATNATQPVVQLNNTLYCCDDGAWFTASSSQGPWALCDGVPESIYSIPASCPIYACTYVEVYGSNSESVTFGATGGYFGTYMQNGTPVYGTGFDYNATNPPTSGGNAAAEANVASYIAPAYPSTYGNQAQYDPNDGTYGPPPANDYVDDYADMYPDVYNDGYGGWGWSPYWGMAYGWGYGYGYGYGDWGRWRRGWGDVGRRTAAGRYAANHVGDAGRGMGGAGRPGGVGGMGGVGRPGGVGGVGGAGRPGGVGGVGGMNGWGRAGGMDNRGMEGRGMGGMGGAEGVGGRGFENRGGETRGFGYGTQSGFHTAQYGGAGGYRGGSRGGSRGGGGRR